MVCAGDNDCRGADNVHASFNVIIVVGVIGVLLVIMVAAVLIMSMLTFRIVRHAYYLGVGFKHCWL